MNSFIFCVVLQDGQIAYGTLTAVDGGAARTIIENRYPDRRIRKLEIKGVVSKTFCYAVVSDVLVQEGESQVLKKYVCTYIGLKGAAITRGVAVILARSEAEAQGKMLTVAKRGYPDWYIETSAVLFDTLTPINDPMTAEVK